MNALLQAHRDALGARDSLFQLVHLFTVRNEAWNERLFDPDDLTCYLTARQAGDPQTERDAREKLFSAGRTFGEHAADGVAYSLAKLAEHASRGRHLPADVLDAFAVKAGGVVELCGVRGTSAHEAIFRVAWKALWAACAALGFSWEVICEAELVGLYLPAPDSGIDSRAVGVEVSAEKLPALKARLGFLDWDRLNDFDADLRSECLRAREGEAPEAAGKPPAADCHVTLLQAAGMVNRHKRTLVNWQTNDPEFPPPDVEGGGGKAAEWRWSVLRPYLEKKSRRKLPEYFPADPHRPGFGSAEI